MSIRASRIWPVVLALAIVHANTLVVSANDLPAVIERVRIDPQTLAIKAPAHPTHSLGLTLILVEGAGWKRQEVLAAVAIASGWLGQCGLRIESLELMRVSVAPDYLDLFTPRSRELAASLAPVSPAIYFVRETRQRPAFDAEAVGRGNSRSRPEMTDSVWVTRAAPDLAVVLAHELVHVLSNSGDHVALDGNLMRDESDPRNIQLTEGQCAQVRTVGARNGLLQSLEGG
jgi:hypothetical protein